MIIACPGCHSRYDVSGRKPGTRARCRCGTVVRIPRAEASASTLSCPSCGAPCSPDDNQCGYCRAVLGVIACPGCYGRVFTGCQHCPHCGVEVLLPARGDPETVAARACPRCRQGSTGLVAHLLGEMLLDECGTCGGVWLDAAAFDRLVKGREEQSLLAAEGGAYLTPDAPSAPSPESRGPTYVPCPECGQLMNRKNFANTSGVIVDVCGPHGIWFDRNELGRIVQFVMKGGLETARRRELEDLERRLKDKRHLLAGYGGSGLSGSEENTWLPDLVRALRNFFT